MAAQRNESELWFERYCETHGITIVEYEPDLGGDKRPDFLVRKAEMEAVCEIKEFEMTAIDRLQQLHQVFTTSRTVELKPIRGRIRLAARQLKPLAGSGRPLVVVLANPRGFHVPLDPLSLIEALYGDMTVALEVGPGAGESEGRWGAGRNGRLRTDHPYISAVIGLRRGDAEVDWWNDWYAQRRAEREAPRSYEDAVERWREDNAAAEIAAAGSRVPDEDYLRADVVRTMSATAVQLPGGLFDGPRDTIWDFDAESHAYVRTR